MKYLLTTDHKADRVMYMWLSFTFFFIRPDAFAMIMRAQLSGPGLKLLHREVYNQIMSLHGTFMVFFWTIPCSRASRTTSCRSRSAARDMAFPAPERRSRFWLLVPAGGFMLTSLFSRAGAAGRRAGPTIRRSPDRPVLAGTGVDLWILDCTWPGSRRILGGINFVVTVLNLRAPGMSLMKMPMFCWNVVITQTIILIATPVLGGRPDHAAHRPLFGTGFFHPRRAATRFSGSTSSGSIPHPAVYIMVLPSDGDGLQVLPAFSDKQLFGYRGDGARDGAGSVSSDSWCGATDMFVTGHEPPPARFLSFASMVHRGCPGHQDSGPGSRPSGAGPSASGPRCSSARLYRALHHRRITGGVAGAGPVRRAGA